MRLLLVTPKSSRLTALERKAVTPRDQGYLFRACVLLWRAVPQLAHAFALAEALQ